MNAGQVSILEGSDARPDEPAGFFHRDMRHLSTWQIRLNGRELDALAGEAIEYDHAVFFLVEPTGTVYRNPSVALIRRRHVGDGMQEQLQLDNHGVDTVHAEVGMLFAADFADIFEIKDRRAKVGRPYRRVETDRVVLGYERDGMRWETRIHAPGAFRTDSTLTYRVEVPPGETWRTDIDISVAAERLHPAPTWARRPDARGTLEDWLAGFPVLETDWDDLSRTYHRSLVDLAALRLVPATVPESSLPAAGLPWFMALFGRDSLITSYQALPFAPELCRTTLRALADQQATAFDDFRDAEPGKILHELRHGELTHFHERPHSPYYGSADSTPLFLVVLDEYERWTGDQALVRELEPAARAALDWIDRYGDLDGDGYIEYVTRNPDTGLVNQCWKDSPNSIVHPDGTPARHPHAVCEIQGYAYDARRRTARLAREIWDDPALTERLDADADALRDRFHRDFWCGGGLLRARSRRGQAAGPHAHLEHRAPAVERHRPPRARRPRRRAPEGRPAVLGLGRPHAGGGTAGLQPGRVPQRHGVAARHRADRGRAGPVRLPRGGRQAGGGDAGGGDPLRPPAPRGLRRTRAVRRPRAGGLPDRVLTAGVGDRYAVAAAPGHAGAGTDAGRPRHQAASPRADHDAGPAQRSPARSLTSARISRAGRRCRP
jgi:glycogen debranching enzyme